MIWHHLYYKEGFSFLFGLSFGFKQDYAKVTDPIFMGKWWKGEAWAREGPVQSWSRSASGLKTKGVNIGHQTCLWMHFEYRRDRLLPHAHHVLTKWAETDPALVFCIMSLCSCNSSTDLRKCLQIVHLARCILSPKCQWKRPFLFF